MTSKVMIATGLLGDYVGTLMRAGFDRETLVKALRVGAKSLEDEADLKEPSEMVDEITKMMASLGYKQDGPPRVFKSDTQCNCPKCVRRRRAERGEDHQDERSDV